MLLACLIVLNSEVKDSKRSWAADTLNRYIYEWEKITDINTLIDQLK